MQLRFLGQEPEVSRYNRQLELFAERGFRKEYALELANMLHQVGMAVAAPNDSTAIITLVDSTETQLYQDFPILVHLSDIHFGHSLKDGKNVDMHRFFDSENSQPLSQHITEELGSKHSRFTNELTRVQLIISGDLTYNGTKPEFEKAREFLDEVTRKLRLSKDRIHIIPGNHDVNWGLAKVDKMQRFDPYLNFLVELYGEASIAYDKFEDWWRCYPFGLRALFFRTRVMGAIGIWPLSTRCAGLLKASRLKESEIAGSQMRAFRDVPARYWYVSGIVLRPELIGGRAIRILLSRGVGSWLSSPNIHFPSELLALAYSKQGQALLEGFNFFKVQNACMMPDRVPLFGLQLDSKEQFVSSLKERGLEND